MFFCCTQDGRGVLVEHAVHRRCALADAPVTAASKKRKLWNKLFGKNGLQRHLFQFKDRLIDTFDTNLIFHKERNQNIAIH